MTTPEPNTPDVSVGLDFGVRFDDVLWIPSEYPRWTIGAIAGTPRISFVVSGNHASRRTEGFDLEKSL